MAEKVLNVYDLASRDAEENGKWYEAKVRGLGSGMEFCLYGPNSNHASVANDTYHKAREQAEKIEDVAKRSEATDRLFAEFAAALVCDVRGKDGLKLLNKAGEPFTMKDVKDFMYEAPVIVSDIVRFAQSQNNFLSN